MKRPVAFGLNVDPNADGLPAAARIAAIADTSGLEYAGIQDHPYNPDFVDTLTQITWLAAHTSRVHLFPNVANLPLRPPTMLAMQAATIDVLSGGRFELGLGAGAFHDGIAGLGGPRRTTGQARQALGEAIDVIRATWAGHPYSYEGEYYPVPRAEPGPRPAHDIGIWLGVAGPGQRACSVPRLTAGRSQRHTCRQSARANWATSSPMPQGRQAVTLSGSSGCTTSWARSLRPAGTCSTGRPGSGSISSPRCTPTSA